MGIDNGNTYDVEYSKEGYFTDTLEVTLVNEEIISSKCSFIAKESFSKKVKLLIVKVMVFLIVI